MAPGDIHWIELPPANGHEQAGMRPGVILQDDGYGVELPVVLVAPVTTAAAASRFPGTLSIQPSAENGLRRPSVILVFQLRAIDRRRILERIGSLDADTLGAVYDLLDRLTGRPS